MGLFTRAHACLTRFIPGLTGRVAETGKSRRNTYLSSLIWADVPDPSVIRVDGADGRPLYYMSSTTMHLAPGVPIMKSHDLLHWEIVNYVYEQLADNDQLALRNGENAYGQGSWASSLRYNNGLYYLATFSYTTGKTHIFKTANPEKGPWAEVTLDRVYHDPSLLFDDDGRVYLVYGSGDIGGVELTAEVDAVKEGGLNQVIILGAGCIAGTSFYVPAEGAHIHKINGRYYIFLITWPREGCGPYAMRTQLVYRADRITGPYEGRVILREAGIAQGGLVDTPDGEWYAMLFQDHGAVGRIPYLLPVGWEDGWPVLSTSLSTPLLAPLSTVLATVDPGDAKGRPEAAPVTAGGLQPGIVATDEFDRDELKLMWQWNHNPDNKYWSLRDRPGYLRLVNGRVATGLLDAVNTLTQRTFGPECSARIAMETGGMKAGDVAGLGVLQKKYGFTGVVCTRTQGAGEDKYLVMVDGSCDPPKEKARIPVTQERVYLRIDIDYKNRADKAYFFASLDGEEWQAVGEPLQMAYTIPHFMGYRFALFNYATKEPGGFVDFDYFRIGAPAEGKGFGF
ncbi:MAG: glycosyl hydrolase 43 family protein [Firmicutes bacterium]|nr:glycosyl hydrolase 43 family protein [Bacillota bacterium]